MKIKMTTSLYEHLEYQRFIYGDMEYPYELAWIDVEGFGYGWLWNRTSEEKWHELLSKHISKELDRLVEFEEKTLYFNYIFEKQNHFHFITLDEYRKDLLIKMSNEEMFPF